MATYGDMQARIANDFQDQAISTAEIRQAIQSAIRLYERKPFYFNQALNSFSTVASQEYYGSAALADIPLIVQIRSARIRNNGIWSELAPVDFAQIDARQDGASISQPCYYAAFNQQLRLYPIPDQVYTVTLAYVKRPADLVADTDTNVWTTEAEEMIRQCAKRRLAIDIMQAPDVAAGPASLEQECYAELLAETRRRLPNGTLRTDIPNQPPGFNINTGGYW